MPRYRVYIAKYSYITVEAEDLNEAGKIALQDYDTAEHEAPIIEDVERLEDKPEI